MALLAIGSQLAQSRPSGLSIYLSLRAEMNGRARADESIDTIDRRALFASRRALMVRQARQPCKSAASGEPVGAHSGSQWSRELRAAANWLRPQQS